MIKEKIIKKISVFNMYVYNIEALKYIKVIINKQQ